jgi:hypothetical protein
MLVSINSTTAWQLLVMHMVSILSIPYLLHLHHDPTKIAIPLLVLLSTPPSLTSSYHLFFALSSHFNSSYYMYVLLLGVLVIVYLFSMRLSF